jgi:two-component system chemotaxis response regulator CheY
MADAKKKLTVLVVDDQEAFLQAVVDELHFLGFETVSAQDGQIAFDKAKNAKFDLIISDIRMPNKDGRWFLTELRKTQKNFPPFLFMTGFADLSIQEAYSLGVDGFLGKPLNPEKLEYMLSKLILPFESRWSAALAEKPIHHIEKTYACSAFESQLKEINFGRGGMYLSMQKLAFDVGDTLSFKFVFESGNLKIFEGCGTIVWKKENPEGVADEYGVYFDQLSQETLAVWVPYIKSKEMVEVIPQAIKLENK